MLEQYVIVRSVREITSKPNKAFSIRGLAADIKISPGAARTALQFMLERGIVKLGVVGKTHQYKANLESPLCRQWKVLFNLDSLQEAKIAKQLVKKIPTAQSILLYGSLAKGTNDQKSDVDLLVIALKPIKDGFGLGGKLNREVNLLVFSPREWKQKAQQDKVFYENVIFDSIVLYGERPVVL